MKFVPNALSRTIATKSHVLGQHSPRILFVAGVVGTVGATVLACKATLKLNDLMTDLEIESDQLVAQGTTRVELGKSDYTPKDFKHDQTVLYIQHVRRVATLYAPAVGLGLISIAMLTKSHSIMSKRNASLTLAYAALEKAYDDYRDRVRVKYGEEVEREIYHDVREETIEVEGKKKVVKKVNNPGLYARFYDEFAKNWQPDAEANRIFLNNQQNWANDQLESQGFLFLNDVYKMLGLEINEIGQYVGWIYDSENGDGHIDFGIYDSPRAKDFINGYEPSVLLDFNVEGKIVDKIGKL